MALTDWYIDPVGGSDTTGTGAVGAPWKSTQHALNSISGGGAGPLQSAGGDRFNIKSGGDDVLTATLSLTAYGTPTTAKPLIFEGYTSAQGDGGIGALSGNSGGFSVFSSSAAGVFLYNMHVHHSGAATLWNGNSGSGAAVNCEFDHATSGNGVVIGTVDNCHLHDFSGSSFGYIGNIIKYSRVDGTTAQVMLRATQAAIGNLMVFTGSNPTSTAIRCNNNFVLIDGNSVYSTNGNGIGISDGGNGLCLFENNIVEGFSGVGCIGYQSTGAYLALSAANRSFNNATHYSYAGVLDQGTDYTDAASNFNSAGIGDLSLVSGSPAKATNYPKTYQGSPTQTSYRDAGALQSQATGGGGGATPNYGIRTGGRM